VLDLNCSTKRRSAVTLAWIVAFGTGFSAFSQEPGAFGDVQTGINSDSDVGDEALAMETENDRWEFTLTPYAWISGTKSTATTADSETTSEIDFSEILDVLDFATMFRLELRKDRWGFFTDLLYLKVSDSTEFRLQSGDLFLPKVDADATLWFTMLEVAAAYRFGDEQRNVDLFAGARYVHFGLDVKFGPIGRETDKDWIDPMLGARFHTRLSDRWGLSIRGDVGGFGVSSDFAWSAEAFLDYGLNKRWDLSLGYRHLDIDYDRGEVGLDIQIFGPMFEFSRKF
jgi:hypothetical protein